LARKEEMLLGAGGEPPRTDGEVSGTAAQMGFRGYRTFGPKAQAKPASESIE
jgi:hypothetical protein